jgi:peptide deformylase
MAKPEALQTDEAQPAEAPMKTNRLFATCLQHEIDHLNGVLFINHISKLKRARVIKRFAKAAKRAEADA